MPARTAMRLLSIVVCIAACGGHSGTGAPDAPGADPDASEIDAPADAFQPVMCGGATCRSDQTCVGATCTFSCSGYTVPGDYASLQSAVDALAAAGQDATICVGDATFNENGNWAIGDSGNHNKALTIIGVSPTKSKITGRVTIQPGWSSITLKGLGFSPPTTYAAIESYADVSVSLIGSTISGSQGLNIYQRSNWLVDATDIHTDGSHAVMVYAMADGPGKLRMTNSYLHGASDDGVYTVATSQQIHLDLVNNTLVGYGVGIDLTGATTALVANNLVTGMTVYGMYWTAATTVTHHHNALWNNAANYDGLASDGANTLKVDCQLGTETIPVLAAGSPCRDNADATVAPANDFYGTPRGTPPDRGAVE